jgi:hypothetical protein
MIRLLYHQKQVFGMIIIAKYQILRKVGETVNCINRRLLHFSKYYPEMLLNEFLKSRTVHSVSNEPIINFSDLWRLQKWNLQMKNCC